MAYEWGYSDNNSFTASQRAPRERIRAEKSSARYKILIIFTPSLVQKVYAILTELGYQAAK